MGAFNGVLGPAGVPGGELPDGAHLLGEQARRSTRELRQAPRIQRAGYQLRVAGQTG